jgi:hypothetical protein
MAKLTDKQTWSKEHLLKSWYGFVYLIAFSLEVIALFSIMFISNIITKVGLSQWILSFLIAVALIWFWGQYMAPKGKRRLTGVAFYIAKVVIYLLAAYSIYYFQGVWWMTTFLVVFIIDEAFLFPIRNEDPAVFFKSK